MGGCISRQVDKAEVETSEETNRVVDPYEGKSYRELLVGDDSHTRIQDSPDELDEINTKTIALIKESVDIVVDENLSSEQILPAMQNKMAFLLLNISMLRLTVKALNASEERSAEDEDEIYVSIAKGFVHFKHFDIALYNYNKAIEINTNDWHYYYSRGNTYIALDNQEAALQDFNEGYRLFQENPGEIKDEDQSLISAAVSARSALIENLKKLVENDLDAVGGAEEETETVAQLQQDRKALSDKFTKVFDPRYAETVRQIQASHPELLSDPKVAADIIIDPLKLNTDMEATTIAMYHVKARIKVTRDAKIKALRDKLEEHEEGEVLELYLDGFVFTWSQTYTASQGVTSGVLSIDTSNLAIDAAVNLVSLFPFGGNVIGGAIKLTHETIDVAKIKKKANTFTKIASNHNAIDQLSEYLGLKLALERDKEILSPKVKLEAAGWFSKFIAKAKQFTHDAQDTLYGQRYDSDAAKLGHKHAQSLIALVSSGEFVFDPRKTLIDRLEQHLLGEEETFLDSEFGFN